MNTEFLDKFDLHAPDMHFRAHVSPFAPHVAEKSRAQAVLTKRGLPDIEAERLFVFAALISNQNTDAYHTRMASSSLSNYARDAKAGVAFLDSHQHSNRIGYSYDGQYKDGDSPSVLADFYTVRGLRLGALATDDFIGGVEAGLIRDVSIGFKESTDPATPFKYSCSICGEDMFSWDCYHIPGVTYEVTTNPDAEPDEQITEERVCFSWVENAELSEVSAVYDGATPDAMIVKATREQRAGRLSNDTKLLLERKHRIELPRSEQFRGVNLPKEKDMADDKDKSGAPDKLLVREIAIEARAAGLDGKGEDVMTLVRSMREEIERLKPFERVADEGKALREQLIKETLEEGVRAFGDKFENEKKREMLSGLGVDTIVELRSTWKALGDANFDAAKNRQSKDDPESDENGGDKEDKSDETSAPEEMPEIPEEAYGGV